MRQTLRLQKKLSIRYRDSVSHIAQVISAFHVGSTVPIPARQIAQAIVSNYINVQFKTAEQFAQVNHTQVICIKLLLLWLQAITLISDSKVYSVSRYGVY